MFDVGFWEIVLIFGLGLLVLGPEKLPRIAAQLGRWVGRARRTASQLRYQLEREIDLGDQNRPRYTPPPRSSQIMPPPGKQTSPAPPPKDDRTQAPSTGQDPAPPAPEAEATREPGSDA